MKKRSYMTTWIINNKRYFIGLALGAVAGFLYGKYVGCLTGTCFITSNPLNSMLYFALLGAAVFGGFTKKPTTTEIDKQ